MLSWSRAVNQAIPQRLARQNSNTVMVRKVFNMMYQEVRGLHRAAYVLAIFAFGSQLLALLRDRLLAHEFGADFTLDIYYAAFRVPDLLFVLFASTLSVYVLIPFVTRASEISGDEAPRRLLSQVFSLFIFFYLMIAAAAFLAAPYLLPLLFPGIADQELLVNVTRILLLQPFFLGLSSLFGVVTQLSHRFILYALSPLIYNLGIIFGILFFYPIFGLSGLVLGVVLGAFGHMAIQWPFVRGSQFNFSFTTLFHWPIIHQILALSVPRALTLSLNQMVLLVLASFASLMTVGSVSVFQFAHNLQSVPLSIIGVSYSVAAFPMLAELYAKGKLDQFAVHIITALRHVIFWSVPAIALIIVLRAQIVRVVLGSGAFDWADTRLTAAVLALLSLALLAQAVNLLIVRAFYAGGKTRVPFYITLFGSLLAVIASYGFFAIYQAHSEIHSFISAFMRLDNVLGSEVLSIAFGYALAMIVQSGLLLIALRLTFQLPLFWIWRSLAQAMCAAIVGGVSAYGALNFLVGGIDQETFIGIFLQGTLSGAIGVVGIVVTYAYFRSRELQEVYSSFQRRLLKTDAVAPQEEIL